METQNKEVMTLHRALSELKLIDSKIDKRISELEPVGLYQKDRKVNDFFTQDEFKSEAQSRFDSVTDLMKRKSLIKSALIKKNMEVVVEISTKKMTIAEALNYKSDLPLQKKFLQHLKNKLNNGTAVLNRNNEGINKNLDIILQGSEQKDKATIEEVSKSYKALNDWYLFNPLAIDKKIESMEKEIEDFESTLDFTLSEVNAINTIEI